MGLRLFQEGGEEMKREGVVSGGGRRGGREEMGKDKLVFLMN